MKIETKENDIILHQQQYINETSLVSIDSVRRNYRSLTLLHNEALQLRSIAGQLNWAASKTHPDLSYGACIVSTSVKIAKIEDLCVANKSVKKLKSEEVVLHFPGIENLPEVEIISFSDASLAR